jgi:hypothetical protein
MLQPGPGSIGKEQGEVADDEVVIVRPSQLACQPVVRSHSSGLVSPEYLVMVVGAQNRAENSARRMARLKACGPGGLSEGLRSSSLS